MTDAQLQVLVEQISLEKFTWPFKHEATFNTRLRTSGGRYLLASHNIEINPKMLSEHDQNTLVVVIKHELCHYHLHLRQAGYHHGDQNFKQLLQFVEGGSRYAPLSPNVQTNKKKHIYRCTKCGQIYLRVRRINIEKYVCSRCGGHLQPTDAPGK